ncbi:MAG: hypothetical protein IT239_06115 [Bacteroidia bacterium]|nr:hypothetical protein [Bacteroidia bacterium]
MSKLYFTRAGAERIIRQKQELLNNLRLTQQQKGTVAEDSVNAWHDNFSFEQLTLKEQMISAQIAEINEKINRMFVVDKITTNTSRLRIGHLAILNIEGEVKIYLVGGFEDSDMSANPQVVSYLSPLISQFVGEEQGHVAEVQIGGGLKYVILQEIKLQQIQEG